jgi:uncharacterized peroxidase-related enzyme|tara:strand:+ start:2879 stop:3427 length:549 start_codon:yes stop_codon:yes gene_type:complete
MSVSGLYVPASIDDAPAASQIPLQGVLKQLGSVPNLFRMIANSPAALNGYLEMSQSLGKGVLPASVREAIALLVAQLNECDYCLSAHAFLAANLVKVEDSEITANRKGLSRDRQTQAILQFTGEVVSQRGKVSDDSLARIREAGLNDAEIVEVVQHVALNIFTNYLNNAGRAEVDFPLVHPV